MVIHVMWIWNYVRNVGDWWKEYIVCCFNINRKAISTSRLAQMYVCVLLLVILKIEYLNSKPKKVTQVKLKYSRHLIILAKLLEKINNNKNNNLKSRRQKI